MQGEERDKEDGLGVRGNEDDKGLRRPDTDDQRERESVGNSLGETHCRRNVNPNY